MELNRETILSVIKKIDLEKYEIKKIGLFGSFARGDATEKSDIDIFVDFKDEANVFRDFFDIKYDLEEIFDRKIDLITADNFDYDYKVEEVKDYKEKVKKEILESIIYV